MRLDIDQTQVAWLGDNKSASSTADAQTTKTSPDQEKREYAEYNGREDSDAELDSAHAPQTTAEKRRAQNELFKIYAEKLTEQVTEKEIKETIKNSKDEELSIREILAKQESSIRITNPRDYQTELFEKAKQGNIIAVLDTGMGKTHIATLLLRHILDIELERRANGAAPKTAFFLVNSVNLVFQQANVLRCGLDQKVEPICGKMGTDLWNKPTWDKLFRNNMVVVCTAEVLVQCMMHSFIDMTKVNLLIFDEAHHAKNAHPFARLMKTHYFGVPDISKRPHVFGMTASPADVSDSNIPVQEVARNLEKMLDCKLATVSEEMLASNNINRPIEEVVAYPRLQEGFETPFHQEMKARCGDIAAFESFFTEAKQTSSELGRWAADGRWSFTFMDEQSRQIQKLEERRHDKSEESGSTDKWNKQITRLRETAEFVRQYQFGLPSLTSQDLSYKVLALHKQLQNYYERTDKSRCIVFVQKRITARLLQLIFSHIGGPNLRCGMIVGVNAPVNDVSTSLRSQIMTVAKFRQGEINCLFATSVAEEGLDIPQCNLVVRFDLYSSMIQYVQSRGRARHRNSKYLHMIEQGNNDHRNKVISAQNDEKVVKAYCRNLPADRYIDDLGNDIRHLQTVDEELFPVYTDPESGAKLTLSASLAVLAHFVATLPGASNQEATLQPNYVIRSHVGLGINNETGFQCEVILPERAPIISIVGKVQSRKAIAKCSAAFEMCIELRKRGFLNENLLPTFTKQLPAMRNALLALKSKDKGQYTMRIKPKFWKQETGTIPDRLYLTVIDVDAGLERHHQPLGILTRAPLPQMPVFPIYLSDGKESNVVSITLKIALTVSEKDLDSFTTFTLQVYEQLYNKVYEHEIKKMSYWVVPVISKDVGPKSSSTNPKEIIDMSQVTYVCNNPYFKWTPSFRERDLDNRYFVDPYDGGRRFYSKSAVTHLKPLDPIPCQVMQQKKKSESILAYSDSRWRRTRDVSTWNQSQPVVEVEKIPFRRNLLACAEQKETDVLKDTKAYVCPEPLRISNFATPFVAMCYILPPIIHRFEDYLIALEASSLLSLQLSPALALEALTKDSDYTDENEGEPVTVVSGMGPNYERLEFLGDCFLKMATSISTFVLQPDENEFEFHVRRMVMLCNKNLFKTATDSELLPKPLQLYEYIRTEAFSRRDWYPEGLTMLQGKGKDRTDWTKKHSLGFKSIADVCEALIGAAFMEYNKNGQWNPQDWDEAVKAVTTFVNSEDHLMKKYSDYYKAYTKPTYQIATVTAAQRELAAQIEETHSYHFQHPRLLRSAFIHPSQPFMWENIPNYQRLEFLGDSLLDMVFIMHLFYKYPEKDPHWLTEHKTPMVSNKFLAAVCVKLDFHHHIRHNSSILYSQIENYRKELEEAKQEANGAVDYWINVSEPPKCLADVVEAYVAAIFVDSEFNFGVVQDFFDKHIKAYFEDMTLPSYEAFATNHPINRFNKLLDIDFGCHEWRVAVHEIDTVVPGNKKSLAAMIMIHNKILFHSLGIGGKYARIRACKAALEKLDGLPPYEFRKQYGCNCAEKQE